MCVVGEAGWRGEGGQRMNVSRLKLSASHRRRPGWRAISFLSSIATERLQREVP
jgi:hypothetical protein